MLVRIAAVRHLDTCPIGQGGTARSESYRRGGRYLDLAKKHARLRRKAFEVTEDTPDRQEENDIDMNELLVEEVSIDGMCGVY
jgi:mycofactocin precursor